MMNPMRHLDDDPYEQDLTGFVVEEHYDQDHAVSAGGHAGGAASPPLQTARHVVGADDDGQGSVSSTATIDEATNQRAVAPPPMSPPASPPMSPMSNAAGRKTSKGSVTDHGQALSPEQRRADGIERSERKLAELKSSQRVGAIRKAMGQLMGRSPASRDSVNNRDAPDQGSLSSLSLVPGRHLVPAAAAVTAVNSPRVAPSLAPSPRTNAVASEAAKTAASVASPAYHSYAASPTSRLALPSSPKAVSHPGNANGMSVARTPGTGGNGASSSSYSSAGKSSALRQLEARYDKAKAAPGRKDAALLKAIQSQIGAQVVEDEQRFRLEGELDAAAASEDWDRYAAIGQELDGLKARLTAVGTAVGTATGTHFVSSPPPRSPPSTAVSGYSRASPMAQPAATSSPGTVSPTSAQSSPRPVSARIVSRRSDAASSPRTLSTPGKLTLHTRPSPVTSPAGDSASSPSPPGPRSAQSLPSPPFSPPPPPGAPPAAQAVDAGRGHEARLFDAAFESLDLGALALLFRVALDAKQPPATLAHGCKLVALLAMKPALQAGLGQARLCRCVVAAAQAHPTDRGVQAAGLEAFYRLGHDQLHQEALGREGACGAVLAAMRAFPADRDVQVGGSKAAWILAAGHGNNTSLLGSGGGCGVVVNAMRLFKDDQQVQEWCARCLINLTVNHSDNTSMCGACGGCGSVVAAMRAFRLDRDVVFSGVRALLNLTCNDAANRARCGSVGACRQIVVALKDFPRDRDLQLFACVVVDNLSRDADNRAKLASEGAASSVVGAMRSFPSDRDVQFQGCRAVYFLTGGHCAAEARAAVRAAMRAFPADEELVEEAADALGIGVQYTSAIAKGKGV